MCTERWWCGVCSISDQTVPQELRGKYSAFALQDSAGVRHLRQLQAAGMTHVHLLPSYDYGSVPERVQDQATVKASWSSRVCAASGNADSLLGSMTSR